MKIAIVDDEKYWRDMASKVVTEYYKKEQVMIQMYICGEEFLQTSTEYDIIFLDVEMEQLDGFQTAIKYKEKYPNCIAILFTMHTELSRKGYMVDAFRYIDKANMSEEILEALSSADKLLQRNYRLEVNVVNLGIIQLIIKDIIFIETEKRNIRIHTKKADYISSDNISQMETNLLSYGFYRCHKSYLVNLDAIASFDHINVYMMDESTAMVSTRKYKELKRKYLEHQFARANG